MEFRARGIGWTIVTLLWLLKPLKQIQSLEKVCVHVREKVGDGERERERKIPKPKDLLEVEQGRKKEYSKMAHLMGQESARN